MNLLDIILHLDVHLAQWSEMMGPWLYVLLFFIVFAETGLVVTPFLPGDSLLFAAGAMTTLENNSLDVGLLLLSLSVAGILGDAVNYSIGRWVGPKVFNGKYRFLNRDHLMKTHAFYEKYGPLTIIFARFIPIVRTFAPFVAGIGFMNYRKFAVYNVVGAVAWVFIFILAGHFFGNLPAVKSNFHVVIFGVIFVSILPLLFVWGQNLLQRNRLRS